MPCIEYADSGWERAREEVSPMAMIVQCAQCQARYSLEEKRFNGQASIRFRCTKCQATLSVQAPVGTGSGAPAGAPGGSPENTTVRFTRRPWLDEGKALSLVVIEGPMKGKIFPVTKPKVLLGRRGTDIVMEDSGVSRKHCAVEVHGSSAMLVDLGSSNGTFVDGQRVETHPLKHTSEFRIGSTTVMFSVKGKE